MANDVCSHVKVVVRVRPIINCEDENCRNVVQVVDNHMLIFDPKEEDSSCSGLLGRLNRNIKKKPTKDHAFVFDQVFDGNSTQIDIFENTAKLVLDGLLKGLNSTVFAYGATGAGKTHTMLGSQDDPGVMYRTMKELFERMDVAKEEKEFDVAFSYLEVYNEQIRDLLANVGPLSVREDGSNEVIVPGLTKYKPKSAQHILEALDSGNRNRTQHPTDMNATSSRSHAVFQLYLRQQDKTASLNPDVCVAKLSLIDLAGSEKASATGATGARLREGANINRSLLALGNIINILADPKSKKAHIPYRNSKLTRILKDSLGGNCRTVMIANISPSSKSYDDTYNTLNYANRAKEIKSLLRTNVVTLDSHIDQYAIICEKQKQEILQLKQKLNEYEAKGLPPSHQKDPDFERVSEALQQIFSSRTQIRHEQLDLERQLKENELRQRYSEVDNLQVQYFCAKEKTEKATCKSERKIASLRAQQRHIFKRQEDAEERFLQNESLLHRVENEIKLLNELTSEVLEKDLRCHRLELQVNDLKQQISKIAELTTLQDQENNRMQKMMNILLPAYSRHYSSLCEAGMASGVDKVENRELEHLVLRKRDLVWADQEEVEQQQKTEGIDVKSQQTNEAGKMQAYDNLSSYLSFSHLKYDQSTTCSTKRPTKRTLLGNSAASPQGNQMEAAQKPPKKMPRRRNLSALLPDSTPRTLSKAQKFEEGIFPLQCTPELAEVDEPSGSCSTVCANLTFDLIEPDEQTASNQTIIVGIVSPSHVLESTEVPGPSQAPHPPKIIERNQTTTSRYQSHSLQDMRQTNRNCRKPLPILGKRTHSRSTNIGEKDPQTFPAPKRVRRDPSVNPKPVRVQRLAGSYYKPRRAAIAPEFKGITKPR